MENRRGLFSPWRRTTLAAALTIALVPALFPPTARAQTTTSGVSAEAIRDAVREQLKAEDIGHGFETLGVFGGTPDASAARYSSNEITLHGYKLPITHSFRDKDDTDSVAPYLEVTLGYETAWHQTALGADTGAPDVVKENYKSYSALGGFGLDIPIGGSTSVRPVALGGYTRIRGSGEFAGPNADLLRESTGGILTSMRIDSFLAGGGVEVLHERALADGLRLHLMGRFSEFADIPSRVSDPSLKSTGSFGFATVNAQLDGPLGHLFADDLRWIAFSRGNILIGSQQDFLGFDKFLEVGGGLEVVTPHLGYGIEGVTLRGSAIIGNGVRGWTIGLGLAF
ncbi:hypothetical protein [Nitrospirillum viridazoti]|uniref:Autotransporter domain-containing protein n=1 Tax=Nitrospirillum viridazoti CBAmc TaxID=1441467 RepID=A0A248JWI3_9PROT|nr:hypothetical protein [Nitrospirillum amazonense]ASG22939.1 hypothetical protein Y958_18820 [Nitrospirillum amazonense CBAmc]TWB31442.1 hypothetical protein FBZ91_11936 [Nitrospirillum amazonense]